MCHRFNWIIKFRETEWFCIGGIFSIVNSDGIENLIFKIWTSARQWKAVQLEIEFEYAFELAHAYIRTEFNRFDAHITTVLRKSNKLFASMIFHTSKYIYMHIF